MSSGAGIMSDMTYCTIVTKSHLSYVRVLAKTLAEHNSQSKLFVLLSDRIDGYFNPEIEPFELITIEELNDQEDIQRMCFYYTPSELCFCLRAWLHEYMFQNSTFEKWIYLDADIIVCHSLKRISDQLDHTSIMLSPHLINIDTPPSIDVKAIRRLESYLLRNGGIYNGGFLALRRTEESESFIRWFKDRLRIYGFDNRPMQSGDQFWLTCVPLYFKEVSVLRDPGGNLAYWNLFERNIEQDSSGAIRVNDEPLLFFHFAGFDINAPHKLSKYALSSELKTVPSIIAILAKNYRRLLIDNGFEDSNNYPYAFANFKSGQTITPMMRRLYFEEFFRGKTCEGSPFSQYEYFRKRLRSQKVKIFIKTAGVKSLAHIKKRLKPDYYLDVP